MCSEPCEGSGAGPPSAATSGKIESAELGAVSRGLGARSRPWSVALPARGRRQFLRQPLCLLSLP